MERFAGAAWLSWRGGESQGAILSQDDHGRTARGFRNRWRYTITGPIAIGLPVGCSARWVTVRALRGGGVSIDIDGLRLAILPADPEIQERIDRVSPVCEINRQLVHVSDAGGRWTITIEEPTWLTWSRARC